MTRILVHGTGGAPAANFIRSLQLAGEPFRIVGIDIDKYNLRRSEADRSYLMPRVSDAGYGTLYDELMDLEQIEFIHSQIDQEISFLAARRARLPVFLPSDAAIAICLDKMRSYDTWKAAGVPVPETVLLREAADLSHAFASLGPTVWIREVVGSGGRNALPTDNITLAREWIDRHHGWGRFSAARCLTRDTVTWMSIWQQGTLVVAQSRRRLYWESANRAPAGVTGITGTGVTCSDPRATEAAMAAIRAVDPCPNGIHSIDMTYDAAGLPLVTENNIGRFFTTHLFFAEAGLNMPYIYTCLGLGRDVPPLPRRINPLPDGLAWIRGMDMTPILTTLEEIERPVVELQQRLERACTPIQP